jgi:hypothetical protein
MDPIKQKISNHNQLRGRLIAVTENSLEELENTNQLTLGNYQILVNVQVICEDCSDQFEVVEILERGGCKCVD